MVAGDSENRIRLDKWLWAARFFKTRSLAVAAVAGGKVHAGGQRVKPAHAVRMGEVLSIQRGPDQYIVTVKALSDRRGPAKEAVLLYEESIESRERRDRDDRGPRGPREDRPPGDRPRRGRRPPRGEEAGSDSEA